MQWECIRLATQMPRYHGNRTEFAHRARRTKHHAIKERPLDMRKSDPAENGKALRSHECSRLFFVGALRFQHRNEFARNERERDKYRRKHNTRNRKHNLDVPILQQRKNRALATEREQENEACDNRRNRHRQVNQRRQNLLALKLELGNGPCRAQTKNRVDNNRKERRLQRQENRLDGIIVGDRLGIHRKTLLERLGNHRNQRQNQHQEHERETDADESPLDGLRALAF